MRAALHNLGCKTNSYETESMKEALRSAGFEIVDFSKDSPADVYIINTCSVTNIADRKSRQMIHRAKSFNEDAIIVAAGCFVQANAEKVLENEPVDIVIGSSDKKNLVTSIHELIEMRSTGIIDGKKSFVTDLKRKVEFEELTIADNTSHTRAFIKIQDGCDKYCTFCIIPFLRGHVRSRKLEDIVTEIDNLSQKGIKEFVFTGINMSAYGADINYEHDLADVINSVNELPLVERIRISSLDPDIVTVDFLEKIRNSKKVCPHFHLSLQSGSNPVLKNMKRGYTAEEYFEKCNLLREYYDNPAITTDIIMGFPGETEEMAQETYDYVRKIGFSAVHVFPYSKRDGTVAADMPSQIPSDIKSKRTGKLTDITNKLKEKYNDGCIGKADSILIEEIIEADGLSYYTGYTTRYVKCLIRRDDGINIGDTVKAVVSGRFNKEYMLADVVNDI
ncbi:tRNA (N(6)-L-threonylcarbamoyladenosine(37)-C(2))-methylthiotransferase MtaB [Howardella ureilytica]